MVLSSSVSSPEMTNSTSLPNCRARSRAKRGYFWNKRPIGCMRVFITAFCKSPTNKSSWLTASSNARKVFCELLPCRISVRRVVRRFLVNPISPDKFNTWSRRWVSIRMVFSCGAAVTIPLGLFCVRGGGGGAGGAAAGINSPSVAGVATGAGVGAGVATTA